jgi:antitoxin component YwqK of YwqJK toxin-antitoxin module
LFSKKWNEKDNTKDENIYELYKNYEDIIILNYEYFSYELEGQNSYGVIKGKIKEFYYNDKILIEDEYLNVKKNGKGKYYDIDGILEFEGEYLYNHKRKGKEYYKDGNLRFEENIYLIRNGVGKDMISMEI